MIALLAVALAADPPGPAPDLDVALVDGRVCVSPAASTWRVQRSAWADQLAARLDLAEVERLQVVTERDRWRSIAEQRRLEVGAWRGEARRRGLRSAAVGLGVGLVVGVGVGVGLAL